MPGLAWDKPLTRASGDNGHGPSASSTSTSSSSSSSSSSETLTCTKRIDLLTLRLHLLGRTVFHFLVPSHPVPLAFSFFGLSGWVSTSPARPAISGRDFWAAHRLAQPRPSQADADVGPPEALQLTGPFAGKLRARALGEVHPRESLMAPGAPARSARSHRFCFGCEGSPKIGYRKRGTLFLTSPLEDLVYLVLLLGWIFRLELWENCFPVNPQTVQNCCRGVNSNQEFRALFYRPLLLLRSSQNHLIFFRVGWISLSLSLGTAVVHFLAI